jgi:uncharacterized membrane protein YpjA
MKDNKSLAMSLIDTLKAQCKRQFIINIIIIICWVGTIGGFIWYINQFDYSTESTATIETENSGEINTGDITNG